MTARPKNSLKLDKSEILTDDSYEMLSVWITDKAGSNVWIDVSLLADPNSFGHLMADTVRHGAKAYAAARKIKESDALQEIVNGLGEELWEQFNTVTTIQKGSLN